MEYRLSFECWVYNGTSCLCRLGFLMWCKKDKFKTTCAKNASRTPDNVETRIHFKNMHAGIKTFLKVFSKCKLTGQSEHLWEDCSRRTGLQQRKVSRQTIAEFSALLEWECPQIASFSFDRRRTSVPLDKHYPVNTDKRVCIIYTQFVRQSAASGDHVAEKSRDHISGRQ